ncbi:MAG: hypothetical protein NTY90_04845 [Candidatus Micrarchaeota archaeon]|nr:hypothetical protein [Candidatus Micrarchaeota archaeon]
MAVTPRRDAWKSVELKRFRKTHFTTREAAEKIGVQSSNAAVLYSRKIIPGIAPWDPALGRRVFLLEKNAVLEYAREKALEKAAEKPSAGGMSREKWMQALEGALDKYAKKRNIREMSALTRGIPNKIIKRAEAGYKERMLELKKRLAEGPSAVREHNEVLDRMNALGKLMLAKRWGKRT